MTRDEAVAKYGPSVFHGSGLELALDVLDLMEKEYSPYAGMNQWKNWYTFAKGSVVDTL